MAEITKPIALDETFNTTEGTSRNIADVLAQGIGDLVTVVSRISHQTTYDELSDLEDVNISSPTNGDVLTYDGSKWTNGQGGGGASVEQMIAPVESSTTASQAYAIGEQFILNGTLYTATAAITAGGTITIGGNCTASDSVTEQSKIKNITFTPASGVSIIADNSYIQFNVVHLNITLRKTVDFANYEVLGHIDECPSNTAFGSGVFVDGQNVVKCALYAYVKNNKDLVVVAQAGVTGTRTANIQATYRI